MPTYRRKVPILVGFIKGRVIETILENEPDGIGVSDIAEKTGFHRETVGKACKRLEFDSVIYRKNRKSPYHINEKMYGAPRINAILFQAHVKNKLRNKLPIGSNEKILFEFGNRIGALIIYSMLQALAPKTRKESNTFSELEKENCQLSLEDETQTLEVNKKWIEFIKLDGIFSEFCQLKMIKNHRIPFIDYYITDEEAKEGKTFPNTLDFLASHELDKESYDKLMEIFVRIYPDFYQEIIKTWGNVENVIEELYRRKKSGKA